jgi:hypothetical protein
MDADANQGTPETTITLNAAFLASARGEWDAAGTLLRGLVQQDDANYAVRPFSSSSALALAMHAMPCIYYGFASSRECNCTLKIQYFFFPLGH